MRRSRAVLGASIAAFLCLAPTSWAAESISQGNWSGSALDAGRTSIDFGGYTLSGTFQHQFNRLTAVTVSAIPAGSGACAIAPVSLPSAPAPRAFSATLSIPCNGTYSLVAAASTTDNNAFLPAESASLDRQVAVAAPAPTPTNLGATADGRSITVTWDDMTPAAPDISGYVVERKLGEGSFARLSNLDASATSYLDTDLPPDGGEATYRVLSTRPSPSGEKVSAASAEATTPFAAAPPDTTGPSGSGDSGAAGGSGSGSSTGSRLATNGLQSASGGSAPGVSPPRVSSGTFLPPLLRPASQTIGTTTTVDTGFNESLPYERGSENPVLPKDAMASIVTDGQAGRGMAIPVATALVLAIWAIHLRMLARAARPLD